MNRRADLEWLRLVLCLSVILQHAVLIFAAEPRYHVKAVDPVAWTVPVYEALRIFAMPPFFAIAGWAAVVSLRRRDGRHFVNERLVRLGIPLLLGLFVLGPVIKYIELTQGRDLGLAGFRLVSPLTIDFLSFLPRYFTRMVLVTWSHLWFLAYLLVYCLALLPLLLRMARRPMWGQEPGAIAAYAPAVLFAGWVAASSGYWPYLPNLIHDWANVVYFALFFLAGAVLAIWPRLERRIWAQMPGLSALAVAGFAGVLWWGESTAGRAMVGMTAWAATGAAWGLAHRWARPWTPRLGVLSEATLPVYVLHHIPLLLIGLVLLRSEWPAWAQIGFNTVASTAVSVIVYLIAVRPWRPMRLLFGMGGTPARAGR